MTGIFYLGLTYPLDNRTTVLKLQKQISTICLPHPFESSTGIIHPRFQGTDLNRQWKKRINKTIYLRTVIAPTDLKKYPSTYNYFQITTSTSTHLHTTTPRSQPQKAPIYTLRLPDHNLKDTALKSINIKKWG